MEHLPFVLEGTVVPGKRLGSQLGFPTANIAYEPSGRNWPKEGVYVGTAAIEGSSRRYLAILNQGRHPTAPEGAPTVEAHLLDFPYEALYGARLRLCYRFFLRDEQAFASLQALQEQLQNDRAQALRWAQTYEPGLARVSRAPVPEENE